MRIKSFFAETVEAAMAQARRELGSDAMLINSRRAPQAARHLGEYEVVFGLMDGREVRVDQDAAPAAPPDPRPVAAAPNSDLYDLRKEIEELRSFLKPPPPPLCDVAAEISDELRDRGFDPSLARQLVEAALEVNQPRAATPFQRAAPPVSEQIRETIVANIGLRLRFVNPFEDLEARPHVAALIGPPGAGKTSMLVKLAVRYGLSKRRSVLLICADAHRVAAAEPLRTYASIVGLRFAAATNFGELLSELERSKERDLVLIDTPGFGPAEQPWAEELAGVFSHFELSTHLVVPAYMQAKSLAVCRERLSMFRPESLMFTRMDETDSLGGAISGAIAADLPLSLCGSGQSIPEDMITANVTQFTEAIFDSAKKENRSAA